MPFVADDNFMVCAECYTLIGSGDTTSFDYYYTDPDVAAARIKEIEDSISAVDGVIYPGQSERDEEFSTSECECCGETLAGARHHCVILGED